MRFSTMNEESEQTTDPTEKQGEPEVADLHEDSPLGLVVLIVQKRIQTWTTPANHRVIRRSRYSYSSHDGLINRVHDLGGYKVTGSQKFIIAQ